MSFKVQHQIRQNASDIRSYLDDLYAWEDQINQSQGNKKPTKSSANPKQVHILALTLNFDILE